MPRGNQRGYKGYSGYKSGAKILDGFIMAGLTAAFGKPKRRSKPKVSYAPTSNSGCLVSMLSIVFLMISILVITHL